MTNPSAAKLRRQEARQSRSQSPSANLQARSSTLLEETTFQPALDNVAAHSQHPVNDPSFHRHALYHTLSPPMASPRPVRLLIASLGNPAPYQNTRHSAGHILLKSIVSNFSYPSLVKNKAYGSGYVSNGANIGRPEYTFWQSASLMNISGIGLLQAWKHFLSQHKSSLLGDDVSTGLIIIHDELESGLGQLKVRRGNGSAKGHNGIKSVQASLQGAGMLGALDDRFVKIGVGIGRPVSREKDDVSNYVLAQLPADEKRKLEGDATEKFTTILQQELTRLGKVKGREGL